MQQEINQGLEQFSVKVGEQGTIDEATEILYVKVSQNILLLKVLLSRSEQLSETIDQLIEINQ